MTKRQTDNSALSLKLRLRRYYLDRFQPAGGLRVLDCCSGNRVIWNELRKTYALTSYWPLDIQPKPGQMAIDSERVCALPNLPINVVDIDTYGSPWKQYREAMANLKPPTLYFLTIGATKHSAESHLAWKMAGAKFQQLRIPPMFGPRFHDFLVDYGLLTDLPPEIRIKELGETKRRDGKRTRYLAVLIERAST